MGNELTKKEQNLVSTIKDTSLDSIIKPLVKEIHLFDSFIAGTANIQDTQILNNLKEGDWLILKREETKFDDNAIMILTEENKHIGYVPEKDNVIFARLMDAGKLLKARINSITKRGTFNQISVGIYLVDF